MSGPMSFGGHRGQPCSPLQMAESDEASRFQTPRGLEAASEAGVGQDRTWGQGDVAIRGGSVWQSGVEVAQGNDVRLGREGRGRGGSGDEYPIESTQPKTVSRGEAASLSVTIFPGSGRAAGTRAGRDTNTPRKNWSGGEFNERGVSAAFTRAQHRGPGAERERERDGLSRGAQVHQEMRLLQTKQLGRCWPGGRQED